MNRESCPRRRQSGFATLVTTLLLLLVTTLVTMYTASTGIFEQNISANQYRAEQSLAAAQAGLDAAIDYYNRFDAVTPVLAPTTLTGTLSNASYSASFCDVSTAANRNTFWSNPGSCTALPTTCPTAGVTCAACTQPCGFRGAAQVGVVSIGLSDDQSGRRVITQLAAGAPLLEPGGGPFQPVLAKASVGLTGNITVINRYYNSTVWAGEAAGMGSNSVESYINDGSLDPATATRAQLTDRQYPNPRNVVLASRADLGNNADVRQNDQMLRRLTPAQLFDGFFANTKAETRDIANADGQLYTSMSSAVGKSGLIYVDGPGPHGPFGGDIGNNTTSTVIIVDGNLKINGGTIYGLLFVDGDVELGGNVVISGALISTGKINKSGGTPLVVFDPAAFSDPPEGKKGLRGAVAGTWKDWEL